MSDLCRQLPVRPDRIGPAQIIFNLLAAKVPREKAETESTLYEIFIYTCVARTHNTAV